MARNKTNRRRDKQGAIDKARHQLRTGTQQHINVEKTSRGDDAYW